MRSLRSWSRALVSVALAVSVAGCAHPPSTKPPPAGASTVNVDLGAPSPGSVPYDYRAGVFLNSLPTGYPEDMFFQDQTPGMVELSIDSSPNLRDAPTEADFFSRLPSSGLASWVKRVVAAGGDAYVRLMPIPVWLRQSPTAARQPPTDYTGWATFVGKLVTYFDVTLGLKHVSYVVWDEPDGLWHGTASQYFELYKYAVIGARTADPSARIGGPAPSSFVGRIPGETGLLIDDFLAYCSKTSATGVGSRLPVDMLVWHVFDAAPVDGGVYDYDVTEARALLTKYGYDPAHTELNVGSWNVLGKYSSLPGQIRDDQVGAAYDASAMLRMAQAGVDRQAFFTLLEDWQVASSEFADHMGLTTKSYLKKASYHATSLVGRLSGKAMKATTKDPLLEVAAAEDAGTVRVLVSNFAPPVSMFDEVVGVRALALGYTAAQLKAYLAQFANQGITLDDLLTHPDQIASTTLPTDLKGVITDVAKLETEAKTHMVSPVPLSLSISGLAPGRYRERVYVVDADHNDPYKFRSRLESEVKTTSAKTLNASSMIALTATTDTTTTLSATAQLTFTSNPYSVTLLELTPSP